MNDKGTRQTLNVVMLLLKFPPHFAGGGLQASRLMSNLSSHDVNVTTLTALLPGNDAPESESAFNGRVRRFPVWGSVGISNHILGLRAALWLLIHRRWDVLHIHGYSYFAVLPIVVAKLLRRPVILKTTVLGSDGAFIEGRRWINRFVLSVYRHVDLIIALSKALKRDIQETRGVQATVLNQANGVDTEFFRPAEDTERAAIRSEYQVPEDHHLVLTCGEINPRKNFLQLIRGLEYDAPEAVTLLIVGPTDADPAYLGEVEKESARLPANRIVRILGRTEPEQLARLLRAADVFVLPSRAEGMPNSVLEAISSGVPCVATDIPGSSDILLAGGGKLVPLDDDAAMGAAVFAYLSDDARRRKVGSEARALAEERYSLKRVAALYRGFYDDLVAHRTPSN